MIEVQEQFDVPAAPRTVWGMLSDPAAVVGCVEGAALGDKYEDGSFDGSIMVKFGPAKVKFNARLTLELDEANMVGTVMSKGKDTVGGTRVKSTLTFKVQDLEGGGSTVPITGEVEVTGKLASLVETGAKLVVKRMTADFAKKLAEHCTAGAAKT